jgi:hypothetical protein
VWFLPLFIEVQPSKVVQDFATIHSSHWQKLAGYMFDHTWERWGR